MSLTVSRGLPSTLTVGDAASFLVTDPDFPATAWTSQIVFKDEAGAVKTFSGSASGGDHLFALTNVQAATLVAGPNRTCLIFSDGTNRQSRDYQSVTVLADPTTAETPTFAQAQVTLLRGGIAALNASANATVSFNGQSFTRASRQEYQTQLTYWEARVIRERELADAERGIVRNNVIAPAFVSDTSQGPFPTCTAAR